MPWQTTLGAEIERVHDDDELTLSTKQLLERDRETFDRLAK